MPSFGATSWEYMACTDKDFAPVEGGAFREIIIPDSKGPVFLFKVGVDRLRSENVRGSDLSALARNYANREFAKRFIKQIPPSDKTTVLIYGGVQSIVVRCGARETILVWVPRSNLRWEGASEAPRGGAIEEARRMIDGFSPFGSPPTLQTED
jgi:hypothetical protein